MHVYIYISKVYNWREDNYFLFDVALNSAGYRPLSDPSGRTKPSDIKNSNNNINDIRAKQALYAEKCFDFTYFNPPLSYFNLTHHPLRSAGLSGLSGFLS